MLLGRRQGVSKRAGRHWLILRDQTEAKAVLARRAPTALCQAMGWFFRCASSASWGLVCYPELRGPLHAVLVRLDESNGARPIGGSATSAQQVSFGEPTAPTNASCVQPERMLMKKGLLSARCVLCCHPSLILAKLPAFATLDPSVIKGQPPKSLTELLCVHPARISCQAAPLDIQAASRHCSVSVQQVAFWHRSSPGAPAWCKACGVGLDCRGRFVNLFF